MQNIEHKEDFGELIIIYIPRLLRISQIPILLPVNQVKLLIHLSSVVRSTNTLKIMMLKMMPLEKDRFKEIINSDPFLSHSPHTTTEIT